ncbi:hypothetical protein EJ02DRAFT_407087 [Clathrospora elynae]|uniref:Uncharacterized protein n=1 Tax=Clathrospora elynae TaxID=706981 RepID=A0A6A5SLA5_9PLEO|nr:hypothetical protein EJ02DRAFT_407087 [Clathrospora elynae]
MDQERVMKRFPNKPPNKPLNKPKPSWREADCLLRTAANKSLSDLKTVSSLIHHLANQNELLTGENEGLRNALTTKKKHNKKGKVLDLQQRQEYHGRAVFWSPRKMAEGEARERTNKQLAEEEKLQKAQMKQLQAANALYNKKLKEERRVATAAKREEREKEKAEKAASAAAQKALQNTQKPIQTSQTGKRKASATTTPKAKQQKHSGSAAAPAEVVPAVPAKVTRSGCAVKLPTRYT